MSWWEDDPQAAPPAAAEMTGIDGKPVKFTTADLEKLAHSDLVQLRDKNADNEQLQQLLAPYEHRAFSREWTKEQPLIAAPSLLFATPGYYIAKKLGFMSNGGTATPASLEQVKQGYKGIYEGLTK